MASPLTRRALLRGSLAAGVSLIAGTPPAQEPSPRTVDADLLLSGGTVYDGSGAEGVVGDVAIAGGRIVAVGAFSTGRVGRTIDCQGLIVAPGFIDLHTHCDRTIDRPKTRDNRNYLLQGCTTVVTGNCGGGRLDVAKFLASVNRPGTGTNVIHLLPQGSLRRAVMGNARRRPTDAELGEMRRRVDEGMKAGAWGMSTGLIYAPSAYADTDELVELARQVARHGGIYASHIRSEGDGLLDAVVEAIAIGRRAGLPVHISHFKANCVPNWGRLRRAAALVEAARSDGQAVTADQYPYAACSTAIQSVLLPLEEVPGGHSRLIERMKTDPALERHVRDVISAQLGRTKGVLVTGCKIPGYRGRRLDEIAAHERRDAVDVVLDILAAGTCFVVSFSMSEDDVCYAMTLPWVATASDGVGHVAGPATMTHPRSFGTFPRKIGHYALERGVVSLAHAIRSASGLPADVLRLADRGYLRPGYVADVVAFDPATYRDRATYEKPGVYATGVRHLFLAGRAAIENGRPGKGLLGRALRHDGAAASSEDA